MKHQTLLFILLLGLFTVHLQAQALSGVTDTLDLGGEDVATTMNANRGLDQTLSNRNWWLDFLKADSIRMRPEVTYTRTLAISFRNYERDPGSWVPYQNLNIFFYLEDLEALHSNLLWQTYSYSRVSPKPGAVRQSPLGGRNRQPAQRNDRVMANPNTITNNAVAPPLYPFVRKDVLGEFNIRKNPRYINYSEAARERRSSDTRYLTVYKNSKALNQLYRLAFYDGTSADLYVWGTPAAIVHPDPEIDVNKAVTAVYVDISAMVEDGMKRAYNRENRNAPATKLNARQAQQAIPLVKNFPIPFTYKRILGARRQQINANLPAQKSSLEALVAQRNACRSFLSPREVSLFNWLIDQKTELVAWQTAAVDGLATILSASGNTATYSQLAVVSEYLRVSTVLLNNLTENPKLQYALERVKVSYYVAAMAAERDFTSKLNE